ncbi:MAG: CCA tRNA nucleotidyltransferase [Synergistaceae bacterium]|nr:CCA tRNA nucleotidyltransferase [Synergistaceae bacterium]MBQ9897646.1 CCA tRNA nucleotidyltransferase [Synergistaceae bacterium]
MLKKIKFKFILALSCLLLVVTAANICAAADTRGFFANPEINKLIDENYKLVVRNGYSELRIPESLHGIKRDIFSKNALDAAARLIANGFPVYLVGETVRDLAAGLKADDFDFSTPASIEEQRQIFGDKLKTVTIPSGFTFGHINYPDERVDLAAFSNIPAAYLGLEGVPEFEPDSLYSTSLLYDSFQRDLTFNALYYDLQTGDIIDWHGGLHDLREGIIETMTDADVVFTNDARFALRALRFKAQFNFEFSENIELAMRANAERYISALKHGGTLSKMFRPGTARRSFEVLTDYGVFGILFPAVKDICDNKEYKDYAIKAMDFLDSQHEAPKGMFIALLLRPAMKDKSIKEILDAQGTIYNWHEGERESAEKILRGYAEPDNKDKNNKELDEAA